MFTIGVFTLFPALFAPFVEESLLGRARRAGLVDVRVHDLRSHGIGVHRAVDDAPYGGGAGMVLAPEPVFAAVEAGLAAGLPRPLYALTPAGAPFDQAWARRLSSTHFGDTPGSVGAGAGFSLLCGRYEGFDQRILDHLVDGELSIGDVVLSGGEVAAMAVIEAVTRLLPGVMGNAASADDESHAAGLLEYPQYTRPAEFRGWQVPEVLRSGDHARVARWRRGMALARTAARRPDLWAKVHLDAADRRALADAGMATLDPAAGD